MINKPYSDLTTPAGYVYLLLIALHACLSSLFVLEARGKKPNAVIKNANCWHFITGGKIQLQGCSSAPHTPEGNT